MSFTGASLVAQLVKNQFVMQESACNVGDVGSIPELTRSLGEGKWPPAPVFLPGTEKLGRLQSMGSQELDMT